MKASLIVCVLLFVSQVFAQQTQQKESKAQERERKLIESRKQHADQTRGQYLPNKFADVYVGKWETEDKSVQLEITKRVVENNYLEFHYFSDVLDVHFTRFEAAGKNIIDLIGNEFEFRYSGGFGWYTYFDDPYSENRMNFVFSHLGGQEDPDKLVL